MPAEPLPAEPLPAAPSDASRDVSVLTIVRGRRGHLLNQARGIARSQRPPKEWVIVSMGEEPPTAEELQSAASLSAALPPLITDRVDGQTQLPLAAARKRAAERATGRVLVFLDVDCIPGAGCLGTLADHASAGGLLMGDIRYLPKGEPSVNDWTEADLEAAAVRHPLLPELNGDDVHEAGHEMFWSLCFGVRSDAWAAIGGFDEGYTGYGAEDTDVGFAARQAGIPFGYVPARAYHQHHSVCKPPLNHVADLVANARRFHGKWGIWPMDKWLHQLADAGYVRFAPDADVCDVIRLPTEAEVQAAIVDTPAGF